MKYNFNFMQIKVQHIVIVMKAAFNKNHIRSRLSICDEQKVRDCLLISKRQHEIDYIIFILCCLGI